MSIGLFYQSKTAFLTIEGELHYLHCHCPSICREGKKKNGVEASIGKFDKSNKKTLCKLEIDKVEIYYRIMYNGFSMNKI